MVKFLQAGMGLGIYLFEISKGLLFVGFPGLVLIFYFLSLRKNKAQQRSSGEVAKIVLISLVKAPVALIVIFVLLAFLALFLAPNGST